MQAQVPTLSQADMGEPSTGPSHPLRKLSSKEANETGPATPAMPNAAQLSQSARDFEKASPPSRWGIKSSTVAPKVFNQLFKIYTNADRKIMVENSREMRFALRLILFHWRELITGGSTTKTSFQLAALKAVDPASEGIEDIRFLTAKALNNIVARFEWGFESWCDERKLPPEHQPGNKSLHAMQEGIKKVLKALDALLEEDGSKDREFSDSETSEDELAGQGQQPSISTSSAISRKKPRIKIIVRQPVENDRQKTSLVQRGHQYKWTSREDTELLEVIRDEADAKSAARAAELHRRMLRVRQLYGLPHEPARSATAIAQRALHLIRMEAAKPSLNNRDVQDGA